LFELLLLLLFLFFVIITYLKRHFHYYVRKQACHTAFFLKCLHNVMTFNDSGKLKCLPSRPCSLKCLLYMRVTIKFPPIFWNSVSCSEFGQYCSSLTLLVHWLMLARWFARCWLLLFDSNFKSWGLLAAVGPLGAWSLVCCLLLSLVCFNFTRLNCSLVWFNFARLVSCICSWTYSCSLQGWDYASVIWIALLPWFHSYSFFFLLFVVCK